MISYFITRIAPIPPTLTHVFSHTVLIPYLYINCKLFLKNFLVNTLKNFYFSLALHIELWYSANKGKMMITEQRIEEKKKRGKQFDVGNITLVVTTELISERWTIPTIHLLPPPNFTALHYQHLASIATTFQKVAREWEQLNAWRNEENRKKRLAQSNT